MAELTIQDLVPPALLKELEREECSLVFTTENGWIKYPNTSLLLMGFDGDTINKKLDLILKKLEGDNNGSVRQIDEPTDGTDL